MEYLKDLMEKKNMPQLLLLVVFLAYLILGFRTPAGIAGIIDSTVGKFVIVIATIAMFAYMNPIVAVIGVVVAYELIRRTSVETGSAAMEYLGVTNQGLEQKWSPYTETNQFPYTLEQEIVEKMAPIRYNTEPEPAVYKPVLEDVYDASPI